MATKRRLRLLTVADDMPSHVRRMADKVNALLRMERHAHNMAARWRAKVIRSGVPAEFARKYPMSTEGHLGRMLQKWTIRERQTHAKINTWKRRFWRAVTGDGAPPRCIETRLRFASAAPQPHDDSNSRTAVSNEETCLETSCGAEPNSATGIAAAAVSVASTDVRHQESPQTSDASDIAALKTGALNGWHVPRASIANLDSHIEELHLSARPRNVLDRIGIGTVRQLLQHTPAKIIASKNCGEKTISEIKTNLFAYLGSQASDSGPSHEGWLELTPPFKGDLDTSIAQLCLSRRARNVIAMAGITTVRELVNAPKAAVSQAPACGTRTIAEIETKLRAYVEQATSCSVRVNAGTKTLCEDIMGLLREKEQAVIKRRLGLWDGHFATLEVIGQSLAVTRERIRQMEADIVRRLVRQVGEAVSLFIGQKLSSSGYYVWTDLPENDVLALFADDCTLDEARLALHFLQRLQPSRAFHFYDVTRILSTARGKEAAQ